MGALINAYWIAVFVLLAGPVLVSIVAILLPKQRCEGLDGGFAGSEWNLISTPRNRSLKCGV